MIKSFLTITRIFAGDSGSEIPNNLPKKQRELFLRIQAQQKENIPENQHANDDTSTLKDDDWYSSDDDNDPLSKMVIHLVSQILRTLHVYSKVFYNIDIAYRMKMI